MSLASIQSLAERFERDFSNIPWPPLAISDPESRAHCSTLVSSYRAQLGLVRGLLASTEDDALRFALVSLARIRSRLLLLLTSLTSFRQEPSLVSVLESEAALVRCYAYFAQTDPLPEIRQTFEYLLLDHLDHLDGLARHLFRIEDREASEILGEIPLTGGRPFEQQILSPENILKGPLNHPLEPLSWVHLLAMRSLEVQNQARLLGAFEFVEDKEARRTFLEISGVEESHVAMLSSLEDLGGMERLLLGQFALTSLLAFFSSIEREPLLKKDFQRLLSLEEEGLRACFQLLRFRLDFDLSPFLRITTELPPARSLPEFLEWTQKQPKRSQGKLFVTMIEEDRPRRAKKRAVTAKDLNKGFE